MPINVEETLEMRTTLISVAHDGKCKTIARKGLLLGKHIETLKTYESLKLQATFHISKFSVKGTG